MNINNIINEIQTLDKNYKMLDKTIRVLIEQKLVNINTIDRLQTVLKKFGYTSADSGPVAINDRPLKKIPRPVTKEEDLQVGTIIFQTKNKTTYEIIEIDELDAIKLYNLKVLSIDGKPAEQVIHSNIPFDYLRSYKIIDEVNDAN